jgi:hypothetical protein
MRERPAGAELIELARSTLREELLAALPEGRRYEALMVMNALAIASRQLAAGAAPEVREQAELTRLLKKQTDLAGLNRMLAEAIRAGAYDPGWPDARAVWLHLWHTTLDRVRESNPKALPEGA